MLSVHALHIRYLTWTYVQHICCSLWLWLAINQDLCEKKSNETLPLACPSPNNFFILVGLYLGKTKTKTKKTFFFCCTVFCEVAAFICKWLYPAQLPKSECDNENDWDPDGFCLILPVSGLASVHPLEVWHPLHSVSMCQHRLLYFTVIKQVIALAPKYNRQAEIRGRVIEWQQFDQSARTQTHTLGKPSFPLSTWRYFVTAPLDERPHQKSCTCAFSASSAAGVIASEW